MSIEIERERLYKNYCNHNYSFGLDLQFMHNLNEICEITNIPYLNGEKLSLQQLKWINEQYEVLDNYLDLSSKQVSLMFLDLLKDKNTEPEEINENEVELD